MKTPITTGRIKTLLNNCDNEARPVILVDGLDGYSITKMWVTDLGPIIEIRKSPVAQDAVEDWDGDGPGAA